MLHLKLARERIAKAYDFLDAHQDRDLRQAQRCPGRSDQADGMGAPIRFNVPHHGFSRLASIGD